MESSRAVTAARAIIVRTPPPGDASTSHARVVEDARALEDSSDAYRARDGRDPDARMDDDDDGEKCADDADCGNISIGDANDALDGACFDESAREDG